jgi:hypothetical protein
MIEHLFTNINKFGASYAIYIAQSYSLDEWKTILSGLKIEINVGINVDAIKTLLIEKTNLNPSKCSDIYINWLQKIKLHTFQGGSGYKFSTTDCSRSDVHHQCIKPEYFQNHDQNQDQDQNHDQDQNKNKNLISITDDLIISCLILSKFIYLSSQLTSEIWNN